MEWQPIETAPKDVDLWLFEPNGSPQQVVGFFYSDENWSGWMYRDDVLADISPEGLSPTHWMTLPEPPK